MNYQITMWKYPGVGTSRSNLTKGHLFELIEMCLELNIPFTVGHVFGNIDGTHPKTPIKE